MQINGLGSSFGQFDFTNMTKSDAVTAANKLLAEGKITANEAGVLDGFSFGAYAPAPGESYSPADDSTKYNFQDIIQQSSIFDHAHGFSLAAANDDALLHAIDAYQGGNAS